jgi:hypothetical protein
MLTCRIDIRHGCSYDRGIAKEQMKKLTITVLRDLLRRAQRATKAGATPTVRKGLELLAAHDVYDRLRALTHFLRGGCEGRISMRLASVVKGYV